MKQYMEILFLWPASTSSDWRKLCDMIEYKILPMLELQPSGEEAAPLDRIPQNVKEYGNNNQDNSLIVSSSLKAVTTTIDTFFKERHPPFNAPVELDKYQLDFLDNFADFFEKYSNTTYTNNSSVACPAQYIWQMKLILKTSFRRIVSLKHVFRTRRIIHFFVIFLVLLKQYPDVIKSAHTRCREFHCLNFFSAFSLVLG